MALAGIGPKWRSIMARAASVSKSPAIVRTALFGAYQVAKKSRTSSSEAALRSSIEPIVG